MKAKTPKNTTSLAPVIVIFCFTIAYMATGYMTLDEDSRHVPLLTGYVTLFLLVLETIKKYMPVLPETQVEAENGSQVDVTDVTILRELTGLLYVAGLAMAIYILGFYVAVPVYLFIAISFFGAQLKRTALTVAVIASLVIYVVFELILETRLYQGLLFS